MCMCKKTMERFLIMYVSTHFTSARLIQPFVSLFFFNQLKIMQLQFNKILTELGLITTVGASFFLLKNRPIKISHDYAQYAMLSQTSLPIILEKFRMLDQFESFEELCIILNHFLEIANDTTKGNVIQANQFLMNRLLTEIDVRSKKMIYEARKSRKNDVITACIDCERDEMHQLTNHCHNILQNILLT